MKCRKTDWLWLLYVLYVEGFKSYERREAIRKQLGKPRG